MRIDDVLDAIGMSLSTCDTLFLCVMTTDCTAPSRRLSIDIGSVRCHRARDRTYKVFCDRTRASAHTSHDLPIVGEPLGEMIMAKGQLRSNREPKKPKQPAKPAVLSKLIFPVKATKPVAKGTKSR
ncbi:conserved protein of unknown function (plasmid) [Pararobbsia alpina]